MIETNISEINRRIESAAKRSNRSFNDITLIAVTKTRSLVEIDSAHELGITDFGENKVQELQEKIEARSNYNWHMIGSLQSNKVKYIIDKVKMIHSLDRKSLAKELDKRAKQHGIKINTLVQVNVSGEETKSGVSPEKLKSFLEYLKTKDNIKVMGLMTMAPHTDNEQVLRKVFRELKNLKEKMNEELYKSEVLVELSMGMSNDYEMAIEEGATIIRVGSSIFGEYDYN
jgi:hypothetical protein